eukprot:6211904-Pleurochrysis_carterae.AAC.4
MRMRASMTNGNRSPRRRDAEIRKQGSEHVDSSIPEHQLLRPDADKESHRDVAIEGDDIITALENPPFGTAVASTLVEPITAPFHQNLRHNHALYP